MKTPLLLAALLTATAGLVACGIHYPHDPAVCTSDDQCAAGQKCLQEWTHPDGGGCLSVEKVCKKPCADDTECAYCGTFGFCARDVCDEAAAQTTCGSFCGDAK